MERLWLLEGDANAIDAEPIPPDGRPEIIVHAGDRWAQRDAGGALRLQSRTLFAGQLTRPVEIIPRGCARVAGAHLRPHGGYDLLGVAQHRFRDRVVDLHTIDKELARVLIKQVAHGKSGREMVDALAEALIARIRGLVAPIRGPEGPRYVRRETASAATRAISIALTLKGLISVADLARAARVSPRQLERLFHERVGLSPKQFVRIVRFQEVLRATRSGADLGWAAVALEHGFYDQAHFINDFKAFVGRTPGEWKINDDSLAAIFSSVRRGPGGVGFFQSGVAASR